MQARFWKNSWLVCLVRVSRQYQACRSGQGSSTNLVAVLCCSTITTSAFTCLSSSSINTSFILFLECVLTICGRTIPHYGTIYKICVNNARCTIVHHTKIGYCTPLGQNGVRSYDCGISGISGNSVPRNRDVVYKLRLHGCMVAWLHGCMVAMCFLFFYSIYKLKYFFHKQHYRHKLSYILLHSSVHIEMPVCKPTVSRAGLECHKCHKCHTVYVWPPFAFCIRSV